jgi:hypothetical protein
MDLLSGLLELVVLSLVHWMTYIETECYDMLIFYFCCFYIISYAIRDLIAFILSLEHNERTAVNSPFGVAFYESRQGIDNAIPTISFIVSVLLHRRNFQIRLFYSCSLEIRDKQFILQLHQSLGNLTLGKSIENSVSKTHLSKKFSENFCFFSLCMHISGSNFT